MNCYMIGLIDGKMVDLTDVKQIMVHGSKNYDKATEMFNKGVEFETIGKHFCSSCGNYTETGKCDCMSK